MSITDLKSSPAARSRIVRVAAATMALAALVVAGQSSPTTAALRATMVLLVIPCALIDIDRRIIPNRITGPGALLAVALGLALDPGHEPGRLLWAAVAGGFLLIAALAWSSGMGMGDVKLLAMMGLFLGRPVTVALFVALLGSAGTGVWLARRHGVAAARKTTLPFGPYLAVGAIIAALAGDPLIQAYISLHH
ncbi:MAG: prepilin peptidase [Solirubrobacteraceae bacterium]|jgi:leader peptidase (prepilin peptidase)/N-methyltransferase